MRRDGFALLMVIATSALVFGLMAVALAAAQVRSRLLGDARWRIEGQLVASSALAALRVEQAAVWDTLSDGAVAHFAVVTRADSWTWQGSAMRSGALVRLVVVAERRSPSGWLIAARRASLLLARESADTVRVIRQRARF